MARKRSVAVATGISAALLASSSAFAVANGIFGQRRPDRVGTFQPTDLRLVPADAPTTAPPTVGRGADGNEPTTIAPTRSGDTTPDTGARSDDNDNETPENEHPVVVPHTDAPEPTDTTVSSVPRHHEHESDDDHEDDGHDHEVGDD